jgi:hypothetical protein
MPTHVLQYKSVQGGLAPIITVGLKLHETWYTIAAYADLGAAYTMLHTAIAQGAGFNYRAGHRTTLQVGDGVLSRCICMTLNPKLAQSDTWPRLDFPRDWE